MKALAWFVVGLLCVFASQGQQASSPTPYEVDEAYRVYNAILADDKSFVTATGTQVIRQETAWAEGVSCVPAELANKFRDAITDLNIVNNTRWSLQRSFNIAKAYEIVGSDTLHDLFNNDGSGWGRFYERYPNSSGIIAFSP